MRKKVSERKEVPDERRSWETMSSEDEEGAELWGPKR